MSKRIRTSISHLPAALPGGPTQRCGAGTSPASVAPRDRPAGERRGPKAPVPPPASRPQPGLAAPRRRRRPRGDRWAWLTAAGPRGCGSARTPSRAPRLTEKPAQKGQEWRTRAEVVSARAAKLTATMRQPSTICVTPSASMARERARCSRKRDRLRDSAVGLRERAPPGGRAGPPPTGILRRAPHGAASARPPRPAGRARSAGQPGSRGAWRRSCPAARGDPRTLGRSAAAGGHSPAQQGGTGAAAADAGGLRRARRRGRPRRRWLGARPGRSAAPLASPPRLPALPRRKEGTGSGREGKGEGLFTANGGRRQRQEDQRRPPAAPRGERRVRGEGPRRGRPGQPGTAPSRGRRQQPQPPSAAEPWGQIPPRALCCSGTWQLGPPRPASGLLMPGKRHQARGHFNLVCFPWPPANYNRASACSVLSARNIKPTRRSLYV